MPDCSSHTIGRSLHNPPSRIRQSYYITRIHDQGLRLHKLTSLAVFVELDYRSETLLVFIEFIYFDSGLLL